MAWFELVAAPLLIAFGGFVVWYLQSRLEKVHELERNLQEERRAVYSNILEPYIRLFAGLKDPDAQAEAAAQLLTYEYRKTAFDLNLVGADSVVRAYNKMMQFAFSSAGTQTDPKEMMRLWGLLLLEIRKSLGNSSKGLDEWDMLRGMITDLDAFIDRG